jgi:Domain of unknown function (DUF397)
MDALNWRKASYSAGNGGGCVEAASTLGAVLIRDTQDRTGPVLRFAPGAWRRFADQVKRSLASDLICGNMDASRGTLAFRGVPPTAYQGVSELVRCFDR